MTASILRCCDLCYYLTNTNKGNKVFSSDFETNREGYEWIFHVNIRSLSRKFDNLKLYLETFGKI